MATIFAALERRGYRRHEIGSLTRAWVAEVLQHEVTDKGELEPTYYGPGTVPVSPLDYRRRVLQAQKYPPHLLDDFARATAPPVCGRPKR